MLRDYSWQADDPLTALYATATLTAFFIVGHIRHSLTLLSIISDDHLATSCCPHEAGCAAGSSDSLSGIVPSVARRSQHGSNELLVYYYLCTGNI